MGMFDRVWIDCPRCGTRIEFQSKVGPCELKDFDIQNVPDAIAGDIIGDVENCPNCKIAVRIAGSVNIFPIT